ncbi:MAG: hypothetical protein HOV66_13020, partial [Streptomycetaceae bacterium]|nr:hypothetical protein [Streptomycetaceae bacterium]
MALPYIRVYVGFSTPTSGAYFTVGHPTLGQVGTTNQIGPDSTWTEITQYVRSWSFRVGASRGDQPTLRYDAGTCSIVLNDGDRRFDPLNLAGPYVVGGQTLLMPMVRVRIVATWAGQDYPLYYGLADDWVTNYDGRSWSTCTLTATDAFKVFAAEDRTAVAAVGAGDDSGARIGRILDAYGWPAADRAISTGDATLQATTLAGNMQAEMLLVQDSEQGSLYMDRLGKVVFVNRRQILTNPRSTTSQALFGDDPAGYAISGELPYLDVETTTPDATLVNSVDAARAGGTEQHAEDAVSTARYLDKTFGRDELLLQTDPDVLQWAQSILYQYAQPRRRFSRLTFQRPRPQVESVMWPILLGAQFADRITVRSRPAGGGAVIEKDCFVRGVEMSGDSVLHDSA